MAKMAIDVISIQSVNPCVARPVYNYTETGQIFCGGCSVNQIIQFGIIFLFIDKNIFRHLKVEFTSVPTLKNDELKIS